MTSQHAAQKDILLQKKGRMLEEEGKLPKKQTCPFAHISIHFFLPTRIQMYTFPKSSDSKVPPAQRPALWVVYGALHGSKGTLCGLETHKRKEKLSASKWATYGRAVGKASYNKTSIWKRGSWEAPGNPWPIAVIKSCGSRSGENPFSASRVDSLVSASEYPLLWTKVSSCYPSGPARQEDFPVPYLQKPHWK